MAVDRDMNGAEEFRLLQISGVKSGVVWSKPTGCCFLVRQGLGKPL
jgi:hypothetical protein